MKRKLIRCAAILIGAVLGWSAAGLLPVNVGPSVTYAEDTAQDHASHAESHDDHAAASHDSHGSHEAHHDDASAVAAKKLVPQSGDIDWYRYVVLAAAGLFIAAIVIGIPAMKLKAPEPAEPDDHDHGHDDHAHDQAHGHAHH